MIPVLLSLSLIRKYYFKKNLDDDDANNDKKLNSEVRDEMSSIQEDNESDGEDEVLLNNDIETKKLKKKPKEE